MKLKGEMPPLNWHNGLQITEIPEALKLTDLESTLVAKRILFIKIFSLVKSRWHGTKDHTTNVPICDDTILETLNKVSSFPRAPDEAGQLEGRRRPGKPELGVGALAGRHGEGVDSALVADMGLKERVLTIESNKISSRNYAGRL